MWDRAAPQPMAPIFRNQVSLSEATSSSTATEHDALPFSGSKAVGATNPAGRKHSRVNTVRPAARDSSLQNSNRVHFPFMGATVHQNAKPRWQPSAFCDSQPYVSDMPVTFLEIKTVFGPEDTAAMITAFEEALKRLNVADREAHMGVSVAKKIVRLAKRGECNPTRLTDAVISSFRAI